VIDYVIWCPIRCGSILASKILLAALYDHQHHLLYHNHENTTYEGDAKLVHSHSPEFFINSSVKIKKIALTRNIFDSAVSQEIMLQTGIGNLVNDQQVEEYRNTFADSKLTVDTQRFVNRLHQIDDKFSQVFDSTASYVSISYEQIKDNPLNVLKLIGVNKKLINIKNVTKPITSRKIPLEKSHIVSNYTELQMIYANTRLKNKSLI
jgi:hypothetical protein